MNPPFLYPLTVDDVQPHSGRLRVGRAAAVVAAVLPRHAPQGERRHEQRRRHRRDGGRDGRAGVGRRHQSTGAVVPEQKIHIFFHFVNHQIMYRRDSQVSHRSGSGCAQKKISQMMQN